MPRKLSLKYERDSYILNFLFGWYNNDENLMQQKCNAYLLIALFLFSTHQTLHHSYFLAMEMPSLELTLRGPITKDWWLILVSQPLWIFIIQKRKCIG